MQTQCTCEKGISNHSHRKGRQVPYGIILSWSCTVHRALLGPSVKKKKKKHTHQSKSINTGTEKDSCWISTLLGQIDWNHTCMCHAVWTKINHVIVFSEKLHLNLINIIHLSKRNPNVAKQHKNLKKNLIQEGQYSDPIRSLYLWSTKLCLAIKVKQHW